MSRRSRDYRRVREDFDRKGLSQPHACGCETVGYCWVVSTLLFFARPIVFASRLTNNQKTGRNMHIKGSLEEA